MGEVKGLGKVAELIGEVEWLGKLRVWIGGLGNCRVGTS